MKDSVWRAVIEVGFIVFLFYSNLLMGELERTASGRDKGLLLQGVLLRVTVVAYPLILGWVIPSAQI